MVGCTPRLMCGALLLCAAACKGSPEPDPDGGFDAGDPEAGIEAGSGEDGGGGPDGAPPPDSGPDSTLDGDVDASEDAGAPDASAPYVLVRIDGEGPERAELQMISPSGTHWRIHEPLTPQGLFAVPRVSAYLPAPDGSHVMLEVLGTPNDGLQRVEPTLDTEVAPTPALAMPAGAKAVQFLSPMEVLLEVPSGAQRKLLLLDLEGGGDLALSPASAVLGDYAVSPDSSLIAYLSAPAVNPTQRALYAAALDDNTRGVKLNQDMGAASVSAFFWSASSARVGVLVDDAPAPSLWVVDRAASEPPVHVAGGYIEASSALFDHEDARVIYDELRERHELRSAALDGSPPDLVSGYLTGAFNLSPVDSMLCFFERDALGDVSSHLARTDGSQRRDIRLAGALAQGDTCEWSQDGRYVIGHASNDSSPPWVHVVQNRATRSLALDGFAATHWVGLSPDDHTALLEGRDDDDDPGELYAVDLDDPDAEPRSLGSVTSRQQVQREPVGSGLRWSRDGAYAFFINGEPGAQLVARVEIATGQRTALEPAGTLHDFSLIDGCCDP